MIAVASGIFILGVILFVIGLVMQNKNKNEYDRTAMATVGEKTCNEPTQVGPSVGPSSTEPSNCFTTYTFNVNGQSYTGVTENDVEGDEIKISYKSSDPSLNRIGETGGNDIAVALIYSGVGMCLLGLGLGFSSLLNNLTKNNTKE